MSTSRKPSSLQPQAGRAGRAGRSSRRVTLADVARAGGVSPNTVSRVVRGDPEVSSATRERITALIEQMGYHPNYAARALSADKTGLIHVILTVPMYHGHGHTLLSLLNAAATAGYQVSLANIPDPERANLAEVPPFRVDGVVILGGQAPTISMAVKLGARVPTVLLLTSEQRLSGVSTIAVDSEAGSRLATQHLIDQGLRRLAHIRGPKTWSDADERACGFTAACHAAGLEGQIIEAESWDAADGYYRVMSLSQMPQGIVTANDQLALGAMRAVHDKGLRVPEDVRVVGFDNVVGADFFQPPLSTIHQPFDRVGREAVSLITEMVNGAPARDVLIAPTLLVRSSSLPTASAVPPATPPAAPAASVTPVAPDGPPAALPQDPNDPTVSPK